ncbi:hypothetical protein CEXT_602811 [Caerostris extrusa]|uniref:Uncharacterized protein n=1 Tax=Caerostris extrusa TaxID=172846 RepID=A0AAV4R216_CAEEX|nr:hypothetical protein CEXT_602811 [Caerostris extrusa]
MHIRGVEMRFLQVLAGTRRERWHHGECRLRSSVIFKTRNTPQFLSNMELYKIFILLLIVTAAVSKKGSQKEGEKASFERKHCRERYPGFLTG